MRLYNTRSKQTDEFKPLEGNAVRIYSCGPTVYDHAHIGNLSSFIAADTLKRVIRLADYQVEHVMNYTDVDDKMIKRSQEKYPNVDSKTALKQLAKENEELFHDDMRAIGNETDTITFVAATDSIPAMQVLISTLYDNGFAYTAEDGVYFSIEAYKKAGKTYGQLTPIDSENTSQARISNDEYDKTSVHDFALWKLKKEGEPSWPFHLKDHDLEGRPGWHIECSAMSSSQLGQPFDIHTGGVDLIFPHHENEIAQSTADKEEPIYSNFFVHSEHLLVDGKKMSKSLNNFLTLSDIVAKGFDPLAFRLMVLQSHYRNQSNFTWDNLQAAQNRLQELRAFAALQWQSSGSSDSLTSVRERITEALFDDINTPLALAALSELIGDDSIVENNSPEAVKAFVKFLDEIFGLDLGSIDDISPEQKELMTRRAAARDSQDWATSDKLRDELAASGLQVRDTKNGQIWSRY